MAGAGLSHDAHILLTEGFVLPVGVLFARGIASGGKRLEIPVSDGERIYSAVSRGFSSVKVPRIYRVRTSSGRELAFSGGKLIVKKGSKISLVEPGRLRPGMHVYVASRIDLPVREGPLVTEWPPWTVLAGGELLTEFRRRLDFLRRRNGLRPVADQLGMSVSALYNYLSGRRNPPMSVVQRILESSQFRDARSFVVKGGLRERPVELPNRMNPILAEFLGIFSVQGAISEGGVSIVIPTVKIERRISILLLGAFGPDLDVRKDPKGSILYIRSRSLAAYLSRIFAGQRIPPSIFTSDDRVMEYFMKGFFMAMAENGLLTRTGVLVPDRSLLEQLVYLALVIGMKFRVRRREGGYRVEFGTAAEGEVRSERVVDVSVEDGPFLVQRPLVEDMADMAVVAGTGGVIVFL